MEKVYDREKLQLASSWKAEKLALEAELEKLRNEHDVTKSNLERFQNLCSFSLRDYHSGSCVGQLRRHTYS